MHNSSEDASSSRSDSSGTPFTFRGAVILGKPSTVSIFKKVIIDDSLWMKNAGEFPLSWNKKVNSLSMDTRDEWDWNGQQIELSHLPREDDSNTEAERGSSGS